MYILIKFLEFILYCIAKIEQAYIHNNINEKINWLRAVQFKCNTSAKSVTAECKLHIAILDYDWLKEYFLS